MIRKSRNLWYIRKFKDAYLILFMWEINRKSLDKDEVENLTNFEEVRLLRFLKLRGYKLCVSKYM